MLKCKDVVNSVSSDEKKSLKIKIQIGLHFLMCKYCFRYYQQLKTLKIEIKKYFYKDASSEYLQKISQIEEKIIKNIKEKSK